MAGSQLIAAVAWLRAELADGQPRGVTDVEERAAEAGISSRTLRRARALVATRHRARGRWWLTALAAPPAVTSSAGPDLVTRTARDPEASWGDLRAEALTRLRSSTDAALRHVAAIHDLAALYMTETRESWPSAWGPLRCLIHATPHLGADVDSCVVCEEVGRLGLAPLGAGADGCDAAGSGTSYRLHPTPEPSMATTTASPSEELARLLGVPIPKDASSSVRLGAVDVAFAVVRNIEGLARLLHSHEGTGRGPDSKMYELLDRCSAMQEALGVERSDLLRRLDTESAEAQRHFDEHERPALEAAYRAMMAEREAGVQMAPF